MTKRILARVAALAAAVLLPLGLLAALTTTAAPAKAAQVIFGPCNALQDGQIMVIGPYLYECVHTGFGWYWVRYTNSCGGFASGYAARQYSVTRC